MKILTHDDIWHASKRLRDTLFDRGYVDIYPVPRGGIPAAYSLGHEFNIVEDPAEADCYVDDLIDSGTTANRYNDKPFYALFQKESSPSIFHAEAVCTLPSEWVVFPWEQTEEKSAEDLVVRLLQYIGEDPTREGLIETPKRFLKAWKHWARGYSQDPSDVLKVFEDGAEGCSEMILVNSIPIFSHCEHHIAPIIGTAWVGYIPNGKIVGLSKIPRLVDIFARRLQVQERLTNQIADSLMEHLQPKGVAVFIEARHLCMESRGIEKVGAATTTSALRGAFMDEPATRAEFFSLVRR